MKENFISYESINSIGEDLFPFIEDNPSVLICYAEGMEEYDISLTHDEEVDFYYNRFFDEIELSECIIENSMKDFTKESIRDFKIWFRDKFVHVVDINEEDHLKYKWNNELTLTLMNMSLGYLDDQYALHKVGGCCPSWDRLETFLQSVANEPFEAELFELVEGNFELFVDED